MMKLSRASGPTRGQAGLFFFGQFLQHRERLHR
jgi:hypothetical protein